MARGVNLAIILGNIGKDPETRYLTNGNAVCNFTVATSEQWRDKESGENKERTEWHRCTAFAKLGEICGDLLHKGSKVYIEGSLRTRQWEKDGQTHYTTEIIAKEMQLLDKREDNDGRDQYGAPYDGRPTSGKQNEMAVGEDEFDDDIPF